MKFPAAAGTRPGEDDAREGEGFAAASRPNAGRSLRQQVLRATSLRTDQQSTVRQSGPQESRFDIWPRIRPEVMAQINRKPGIFRSYRDVLCVLVIGIATLVWGLYLLGMFQDFQNWKWMLGY